ncbi:addiction module protein [Methyloceanibacter marginalis]|uniref:addiction module protein n=1 Tax=Methyloceanibacter marginalis TaxID=1774971 RepID=UPI00195E655B
MNAKIKALSEEARRLSPEERIALVEDLLKSLDPADPEIEKLWAEEARDRLQPTGGARSTPSALMRSWRVSPRSESSLPQGRTRGVERGRAVLRIAGPRTWRRFSARSNRRD